MTDLPAVPEDVFVRALRALYARRFPDHDHTMDLLVLDRDVDENDFRAALAVAYAAGLTDDADDTTYLRGAGPDRDGFTVSLEPSRAWMLRVAAHLIRLLEKDGGVNYVQWDIKPAGQWEPYRLICVRPGKKSPHELRQEAESKAERLERELEALRAEAAK